MKGKCSVLLISRILCIKTRLHFYAGCSDYPQCKQAWKEGGAFTHHWVQKLHMAFSWKVSLATGRKASLCAWPLVQKPFFFNLTLKNNKYVWTLCMKSLVFINPMHDYNLNAQNSNSVKSFWSIQKNRIIVQHALSETFITEENIGISSNDETHSYFFYKCLLT